MYTHCPHCDTYFRVTSEQLKSAQGDVRCGRCYGTFNALESLVDQPPTTKPSAPASPVPTLDNADTPKASTEAPAAEPENKTEKTTAAAPNKEASGKPPSSSEKNLKQEHSQNLIKEIQDSELPKPSSADSPFGSPNRSRPVVLLLVSLLLLLTLTTQYAYFNLKTLSQNADLRPALGLMCEALGCELDLQRAPHMIKLVKRDIRAHSSKKNVLVVNAVMINDAGFQQAFPVMQLSMQDITGHIMSGRRFVAEEYLSDPSIDIKSGIAPKQSINVQLELIDPGKEAVGFEFEFF